MEKPEAPEFETRDIIQYLGFFALLLFALTYMPYTSMASLTEDVSLWIFYTSVLFLILMPVFKTIKAWKLAKTSFGISMILVAISMFLVDMGDWNSDAVMYWTLMSIFTIIIGVFYILIGWLKNKSKFKEMGIPMVFSLLNGILILLTVWLAGHFGAETTQMSYTLGLTITSADLYPQMIYFGGRLAVFWGAGTIVTSILTLIKKYTGEIETLDQVKYVFSSLTKIAFIIGALYAGMGPTWISPDGALFGFFARFAQQFNVLWAFLGISFILSMLYRIIVEGKAITK